MPIFLRTKYLYSHFDISCSKTLERGEKQEDRIFRKILLEVV